MYQHERSLVQKYKNRPFVLLGINTDEKSRLAGIIRQNNLTWNSWADGPAGALGPIITQWNVRSFPTLILIDGQGKIRMKGVHEHQLDQEIERLVHETEMGNTPPATTTQKSPRQGSP